MPEPQAVILYGEGGNASTVQQLDALVADIMADRSRYERMLAWKHKPVSSCVYRCEVRPSLLPVQVRVGMCLAARFRL
jgi:hypothetical protein